MLSGSRFGFFSNWVAACFLQRGTTLDEMEELISCVRNGANPSVTCFSSHVSNGSSVQDVGDLERVHSWYTGVCCLSASKLGVTVELLPTIARIILIFSETKLAKCDASSCLSPFCGRHADVRCCWRPDIR